MALGCCVGSCCCFVFVASIGVGVEVGVGVVVVVVGAGVVVVGVGVVVVVVVFVVSDLPIQDHRRSGPAGHYRVAPLTWHWVVVFVLK